MVGSHGDEDIPRWRECRDELTSKRIASGVHGIRADGRCAAREVSDTPGGARGRLSDAVVAECAGFHFLERAQLLDVETCAHSDPMYVIRISLAAEGRSSLQSRHRGT